MADEGTAKVVLEWGIIVMLLILGFGGLVLALTYIASETAKIWRKNKNG